MYQIQFFPNRPKHNTKTLEEYCFKLLTLFAPAQNVSKDQGGISVYLYFGFGLGYGSKSFCK